MNLDHKSYRDFIIKSSAQYQMYHNDIKGLGISSFIWEDIPESMDSRVLELCLFENGSALITEDELYGLINLSCTPSTDFDIYGNPYYLNGYSRYNSYNIETNKDNSVIIWNNVNRTSSMFIPNFYAYQLAFLDIVIQINTNAQKTPILLEGTDKQELFLKNLYMEYDGGSPVLFGNSSFDFSGIRVIKTDAPYVADKIYNLKEKLWNEMLTRLGISSVQYQKKERLIKDEIESGLGGTIAFRNARLSEREKACERINKMFNTKIKVYFNEKVGENGELYNASTNDM